MLGDILPVGPGGLAGRGDGPREKWPRGERWPWCFQDALQADRELSSLCFLLPAGFEACLLLPRWGPSSGVLPSVFWGFEPLTLLAAAAEAAGLQQPNLPTSLVWLHLSRFADRGSNTPCL